MSVKRKKWKPPMKRSNVVICGLIGLVGAILLTAGCLAVMNQGSIPALLTGFTLVWGMFLFLAVFSVAEIPLMLLAMRRIAASANRRATYVALLTVTGYTFFAAVYAAPFILLTGYVWAGAALAGLSLARFISVLAFLPTEK
jgi:hypothetical protein